MITMTDLIAAADTGTPPALPTGADARRAREAAGLGPTSVAAAVGIAERTILGYERGERNIRNQAARIRLGRVLRYLNEHPQVAA